MKMAQYIDKDALVAEMKRRIKSTNNDVKIGAIESLTISKTLNSLISFISTLEVKEVDLDKEIDEWCSKCISDYGLGGWVGLAIQNVAKHFFELGLKMNQKGE